jgi:hypothetical protein
MNYKELSDNYLRMLVAEGNVDAIMEMTERREAAEAKVAKERAEMHARAYIRRRGGEPNTPNRK